MSFNRVNPPKQVVLPPEVSSNLQLKKAFDDVYYILFQIWKRTGAGDDFIDESLTGLYQFDDIPVIDVKQSLKDSVYPVILDHTTSGDETVICNAALTVSLNNEPDDRELAKIIVANGDVVISGNGRLLNKDTDQTVIFDNLSTPATVDCIYLVELDEWFII